MTPAFRRLAQPMLDGIEHNGALRVMLGAARDTSCINNCVPTIQTDYMVIAGMTRIRYPEARAMKTIVTNVGTTVISLFEDLQLVGLIQPQRSLELLLGGKRVIHGDATSGQVVAQTYLRCQCGHPERPYIDGNADVEPIGAFLL